MRLLPYGILVPFGSFIAAVLTGKLKAPPVFVLLCGAVFQTTGICIMSTLPVSKDFWTATYAFEVITGLGTGLNLGTLVVLTPAVSEKRDLGKSRLKGKALSRTLMWCSRCSSSHQPISLSWRFYWSGHSD